MGRYIKGLLEKQFEDKMSGELVRDFLVLDMAGVGGVDNNKMRGELQEKGVKVLVVRNLLFKRVLDRIGISQAKGLFEGPCAIVYGGDSIVDAAKITVEWGNKISALEVKGAFVDGERFDSDKALELSKMPTRLELQGEVVMLMQSPGGGLAGLLSSAGGVVAGCIKSLVDKLEKAGETRE